MDVDFAALSDTNSLQIPPDLSKRVGQNDFANRAVDTDDYYFP